MISWWESGQRKWHFLKRKKQAELVACRFKGGGVRGSFIGFSFVHCWEPKVWNKKKIKQNKKGENWLCGRDRGREREREANLAEVKKIKPFPSQGLGGDVVFASSAILAAAVAVF